MKWNINNPRKFVGILFGPLAFNRLRHKRHDIFKLNLISCVEKQRLYIKWQDKIMKIIFPEYLQSQKTHQHKLKKKHFYYWITVVLFDPNESKMCFFNKNAILEQISIYYCLHILFIATLWIFKIKKSLQLSLRSSHSGMISKIVVLQLQSNSL